MGVVPRETDSRIDEPSSFPLPRSRQSEGESSAHACTTRYDATSTRYSTGFHVQRARFRTTGRDTGEGVAQHGRTASTEEFCRSDRSGAPELPSLPPKLPHRIEKQCFTRNKSIL